MPVMRSVVMLNVIMLSVIMLNVVMLSVVAPECNAVPGKPFQPRPMFLGKAEAFQVLLALLKNIRLGWNGSPGQTL
jgi:hypothetical protein